MHGVADAAEFVEPALIPAGSVRIAAFDGENADPANGRAMGDGVLACTPWGEMAYAPSPEIIFQTHPAHVPVAE